MSERWSCICRTGIHVPVVPVAERDALAKRVEELEKAAQHFAELHVQTQANCNKLEKLAQDAYAKRDAALRVVEAVRELNAVHPSQQKKKYALLWALRDALATFDKVNDIALYGFGTFLILAVVTGLIALWTTKL